MKRFAIVLAAFFTITLLASESQAQHWYGNRGGFYGPRGGSGFSITIGNAGFGGFGGFGYSNFRPVYGGFGGPAFRPVYRPVPVYGGFNRGFYGGGFYGGGYGNQGFGPGCGYGRRW